MSPHYPAFRNGNESTIPNDPFGQNDKSNEYLNKQESTPNTNSENNSDSDVNEDAKDLNTPMDTEKDLSNVSQQINSNDKT